MNKEQKSLVVHWKREQYDVYIGRPSKWGNPFSGPSKKENIDKYEVYARKKFSKTELLQIKDKKLGCWCKPSDCHGDVLVKLIAEIEDLNEGEDVYHTDKDSKIPPPPNVSLDLSDYPKPICSTCGDEGYGGDASLNYIVPCPDCGKEEVIEYPLKIKAKIKLTGKEKARINFPNCEEE